MGVREVDFVVMGGRPGEEGKERSGKKEEENNQDATWIAGIHQVLWMANTH